MLRAFGGVNETYGCSEAELSSSLNFSARGYPALQTRAVRKKVRAVKDVNGMYDPLTVSVCLRQRENEALPKGGLFLKEGERQWEFFRD